MAFSAASRRSVSVGTPRSDDDDDDDDDSPYRLLRLLLLVRFCSPLATGDD